MPPIIPGLLFLTWLLVISAALGRRLILWMNVEVTGQADLLLLSVGLGFGTLQFVPFFLFTVGAGHPVGQQIVALLLTISLARDILVVLRLTRKVVCGIQYPVWMRVILAVYAVLLVCSFLRALCPALPGDSLNYHLPAAVRPLQTGRFGYIPTLTYTNWPSGTEMLFALVLGICPAAGPALIQFVAGLIVCWAAYSLGARMMGQYVGLATLVLLLLLKDFWAEISTSMVDVTLTAYTTLAVFCLHRMSTAAAKEEARWFTLAALFAGLAGTCKLTGLWAILSVVTGYMVIQIKRKRCCELKRTSTFALLAILVVTPWFVKTWIITGNPFYPMLFHWIGGIEWTEAGWVRFQLAHLIYNAPSGTPPTPEVLYAAHRLFAAVGVSLGAVTLYVGWRSRSYILTSVFGVFLACISVGNYFNPRFLLPVLPVLLICAVTPIKRVLHRKSVMWGLCGLCGLLAAQLIVTPPKGWVATVPDALRFALGDLSEDAYLRTHISDIDISNFANRYLPVDARILLDGNQPTGLYHCQALISTYNLQDSIHYDSQAQLTSDLRRLRVAYLVLSPYPADCAANYACSESRERQLPQLEELAAKHGKPLYRSGEATLFALNLSQ